MLKPTPLLAVALLLALTLSAQAADNTLYRNPTLSRDRVAFEYGGDVWTVPREGGTARRLTVGVGIESGPRFSPDGATVAFTGEYDGNTDVFIVPAAGGEPARLTWHPGADSAVGWTPDGKAVLFRSARASNARYSRLFTVPIEGGYPTAVPLPHAFEGSYSPDAKRIAYQPISQWQPDWKRHEGGQTGRIWLAQLSDSSIVEIPRDNSNDTNPMWIDRTVYFLSDRDGGTTLYAYDTRSANVSRVIDNEGLDLKSASAGPDGIVYERFGTLWIHDPRSGDSRRVTIDAAADQTGVRPRFENVGQRIATAEISPTGVRAVFEARGEILTVPAKKGDPRNLTRTPGVMERNPAWSPDGRSIAYFSDASGEYALHVRDQLGVDEPRVIALGPPETFFYSPVWSPDSSKIAYADRRLNLWYVDVEDGNPVKVDTSPVGLGGTLYGTWSPDSRWITYSRKLSNLLSAIFVYSVEDGTTHQITDGLSDAGSPVFDRGGKYLYFTASTDVGRALSWADLSGIDHTATHNVYAIVLPDDLPSPLAPESDDEDVAEDEEEEGDEEEADDDNDKKDEGDADGEDQKGDKEEEEEPVRIDLEGIGQRILALPIPTATIRGLATAGEGKLFVIEAPSGGGPSTVRLFDLEKREAEQVLEGVGTFVVSANGEKVLFSQRGSWTIASAASVDDKESLNTSALQTRVDPRAEWRQMFAETWRGERDFFYDPGYHGLDLERAERLYAPYVDAVAHRSDLTYLFREMLNQLTIGHLFVGGGDMQRPDRVPGGLLGCDFDFDSGLYRFARIYNGENWNPDLRAPLTQPGVNVKAGEYLLRINGRELTADDNVHEWLENTADRQVTLQVAPAPDGEDARDVTIVPVANDAGLRRRAWIENNRRKVDALSGGRLAYVYIPNTGGPGYDSFVRYFFAQTDKAGAVIDERYNGGGLLADFVVNYLTRPQLSAIHFRYADHDVSVPAGAIYGPKTMLINEMAGSGGDAMPWYFKKMQIGPLIGTRTWGGLVASQRGPQLMDGGFYTAPDAAVYGLDGEWEVENVGVAPDIEVVFDPAAWRKGTDPQLERAVEYLLEELERKPRIEPRRPEFPTYERGSELDR